MMLKFEMLERKSDALGAYGFNFCLSSSARRFLDDPRFPSVWDPLAIDTSTMSALLFGVDSGL